MIGESLETNADNSPSSQTDVLPIDASKPVEQAKSQNLNDSKLQEGVLAQVSHPFVEKVETPAKLAENWWLKHLKEHPFRALSLAVSVYGGLILLMFFAQLGSMPELDLAGTTATLAAVAVIGLLVVFVIGGITIVAGLVTRSLALEISHLADTWSLVFLAAPGGIFTAILAVSTAIEAEHVNATFWLWITLLLSLLLPIVGCWNQFRLQKKIAIQADASLKRVVPPISGGSIAVEIDRAGWLCCTTRPESTRPQTPDGVMPRPPSRAFPILGID